MDTVEIPIGMAIVVINLSASIARAIWHLRRAQSHVHGRHVHVGASTRGHEGRVDGKTLCTAVVATLCNAHGRLLRTMDAQPAMHRWVHFKALVERRSRLPGLVRGEECNWVLLHAHLQRKLQVARRINNIKLQKRAKPSDFVLHAVSRLATTLTAAAIAATITATFSVAATSSAADATSFSTIDAFSSTTAGATFSIAVAMPTRAAGASAVVSWASRPT